MKRGGGVKKQQSEFHIDVVLVRLNCATARHTFFVEHEHAYTWRITYRVGPSPVASPG